MTDPTPVVQYRNLAGALVTVADMGRPINDRMPENRVSAECGGCLEVMNPDAYTTLRDSRKWASNHAAACAAIPRVISAGEAERETYGALAGAYAARAVWLLEGRAPKDGSTATVAAQEDPLAAAGVYAGLADVYTRLSGR